MGDGRAEQSRSAEENTAEDNSRDAQIFDDTMAVGNVSDDA